MACSPSPAMIRPAAGLYPDNPDQRQAEEMVVWIRKKRARLWAIGEVGLDFWIAKAPEDRELQAKIFSMFVDLSLELDLPLNVHSRSAGRHVIGFSPSRIFFLTLALMDSGRTRYPTYSKGKAQSAKIFLRHTIS